MIENNTMMIRGGGILNCLVIQIQSLISPFQRRHDDDDDDDDDTRRRDFAHLPRDVVVEILKRLRLIDIIRAKALCSSWKLAAETVLGYGIHAKILKAPWLFLAPVDKQLFSGYKMMNLLEQRLYCVKKRTINLFLELNFITSSLGWLIFWSSSDLLLILWSPFTESRVQIPAPECFSAAPDNDFKVILTNPNPMDDAATGIVSVCCYINQVLYCDKKVWVELEEGVKYGDIMWNEDRLYALRMDELIIDMWSSSTRGGGVKKMTSISLLFSSSKVPPPPPYRGCYLLALVDDDDGNREIAFVTMTSTTIVYKLDLGTGKLERVKSLVHGGNRVICDGYKPHLAYRGRNGQVLYQYADIVFVWRMLEHSTYLERMPWSVEVMLRWPKMKPIFLVR